MRVFAKEIVGGMVGGFELIDELPEVGPAPEWYEPYIAGLIADGAVEVTGGWPLQPRPSAAARTYIAGGVVSWQDPRALIDTIAAAVTEVDRLADIARAAVVGDAVRVKEYEQAQIQAEAYRDAGFSGPVPDDVACWATAKRWTAQEAAEDILAAAARWLGALSFIRNLRLNAKEDMRRATDNAAVDSRLATFAATLTAAMQGVQ